MGEIEQRPTPGSRLGAPENSGISTLERGQKPPPTPSGKLVSIKIQMLDDTQEAFEVPVSWGLICEPRNVVGGSLWCGEIRLIPMASDTRRLEGLRVQHLPPHPLMAPLTHSGFELSSV